MDKHGSTGRRPAGNASHNPAGLAPVARMALHYLPLLIIAILPRTADAQDGLTIYRTGIYPDGTRVIARVYGDVEMSGRNVACAKCHRDSGYGSDEAGRVVPAIAARVLFANKQADRAEQFRSLYQEPNTSIDFAVVRSPKPRPAYTAETLARAIRNGVAADGRQLSPLMPRFHVGDEELTQLTQYLKSLSQTDDPGVTNETIHFAVVVEADTRHDSQTAMLDVITAFVERHNLDVERYRSRTGFSANYKEDFRNTWRTWKIHVWEISSDAAEADRQLEQHRVERPVFALVSGIATSWQPVQDFCDRYQIPSLFPNTQLPGIADVSPGYGLYLTGGIVNEAAAVAKELSRLNVQRVTQIVADSAPAKPAADALNTVAKSFAGVDITTVALSDIASGADPFKVATTADAVVLWLTRAEAASFQCDSLLRPSAISQKDSTAVEGQSKIADIIASGSLLNLRHASPPQNLPAGTVYTWPWALPEDTPAEIHRMRAWLRSRGIASDSNDEAIQLNTYFALSVTEHSLRHMVGHFSRDYLIERIEHETENGLNPGVYARMSLAPGQRFASGEVRLIRSATQQAANVR